jgi:hypothetical protein
MTGPPDQLARVARAVQLGLDDASGAHVDLRPLLRGIAAQRLRARRIDLDRDPRAAELLGPEAWELLRPDRPRPADPFAPGFDEAALVRVLDAIEAL